MGLFTDHWVDEDSNQPSSPLGGSCLQPGEMARKIKKAEFRREDAMETSKPLSRSALEAFFFKERPVFIRNISQMQVSLEIPRKHSISRRLVVAVGDSWKKLSFPFEDIKRSADLKNMLVTRIPPALELWLGEGEPPEWEDFYDWRLEGDEVSTAEADHAAEAMARVQKMSEDFERSAARIASENSEGREEAARFMDFTFNKVFDSFSDDRDILLGQIEFHKNSLAIVEERLAEVDPVYGVLLWLKDNVFEPEVSKELVRAALRGENPAENGDDFTLPLTYKSMMDHVNRLDEIKLQGGGSMRGAMMRFSSEEQPANQKKRGRPKKVAETVLVPPKEKKSLRRTCKCDLCDFKAKGTAGLGAHKAHKHGILGTSAKALARQAKNRGE